MLLPIIDSFIKEVNNLAGDPNSPSFDEELSSCLFVMTNETNPVNLGCKFFMLNISLSVLRKILTYLTILKLRSDSLRSNDGEPIDQAILTLALKGIVYAIGREEEPIENWKARQQIIQTTAMEISSGDEIITEHNLHPSIVPSRVFIPTSITPATVTSSRSVRHPGSHRTGRNATDLSKAMIGPRPGTSKQLHTYSKSPNRSESASDESTPGKQLAKGLLAPTRGPNYQPVGRRGRTSSASSASSASPLSILAPSPSTESLAEPSRASPSATAIRFPVIQKHEAKAKSRPSTSSITSTSPSSCTFSSPLLTPSSSAPQAPIEPTFGLIVTLSVTGPTPIQDELIQVLEPYKDKIETTPFCGSHFFIKLKCKKDIYFLKRQIEITTRLLPRIVVTKFPRFALDVPKQSAPTIREFVNLNVHILKGEYYVYSRVSSSNDNLTTIEILASPECQQSIENSNCLLKVGQETRRVVQIGYYQECPRCFFCYDDIHNVCSKVTLMEMEGDSFEYLLKAG